VNAILEIDRVDLIEVATLTLEPVVMPETVMVRHLDHAMPEPEAVEADMTSARTHLAAELLDRIQVDQDRIGSSALLARSITRISQRARRSLTKLLRRILN
jgi:hypothetical protein